MAPLGTAFTVEQGRAIRRFTSEIVLLFDGDRAVTYINGFGLSPSQHELMGLALERTVRSAGAAAAAKPPQKGGGGRVRSGKFDKAA